MTEKSHTRYTFTMPESDVTVEVTFAVAQVISVPSNQATTMTPSVALPFTDVSSTDWYYSAVQYVYSNGR